MTPGHGRGCDGREYREPPAMAAPVQTYDASPARQALAFTVMGGSSRLAESYLGGGRPCIAIV